MCPAHVAKSHFTDIAVSGRFPYSYAYRATQTAMKKPPAIRAENDALIAETEADIEHLKSLIEQAEARIEDSKQKTSDSSTAIQKEKEAISQLLEFANGVAGKEGAQ